MLISKMSLLNILFIFIFVFTPTGFIICKDKLDKEGYFKIIAWDIRLLDDMDILQNSTYSQLISKSKPYEIFSDKHIIKYYWDEQLIIFDSKRIYEDTGHYFHHVSFGLFSIVLNNKFIYHGISRMQYGAMKDKYNDSNYPAIITLDSANPDTVIVAIKPRFYPLHDLFRHYDAKDKKSILNNEVLKYFEEQGKIIRGKIDLDKLVGYKYSR